VRDEESRGVRPLGGAARWWLAQSLRRLQASLQAVGAELVLRRGAAARVIPEVARAAKASAVLWNEIWRRLQALDDPPAPLPVPKRLTTIAGSNPANWQWAAGCGSVEFARFL
jgi:deoxyribodipyrimidine photolyase